MTVPLSGMNLKELRALHFRVEKAIRSLEKTQLSKARMEVAKVAKDYGVSLEQLIEKNHLSKPKAKPALKGKVPKRKAPKRKAGTKKVAAKYQHPNDASLNWTGRGLKPKWVVELLNNDMSLSDLAIK